MILIPVLMVQHDVVATHFNCLDLRNKLSFSMPLAPCNTNTGAKGITCTRGHVSPYFDNCAIYNSTEPQRYISDMSKNMFTYLNIVKTCIDM